MLLKTSQLELRLKSLLSILEAGNYKKFIGETSQEIGVISFDATIQKMRGVAFSKIGRHDQAVESFRKAKALGLQEPGLENLLSQSECASWFVKEFKSYTPKTKNIEKLYSLGALISLNNSKFSNYFVGLKEDLLSELFVSLMGVSGACDPKHLVTQSFQLIKRKKIYKNLVSSISKRTDDKIMFKSIAGLNALRLFTSALSHSVVCDLQTEELLIWLRRMILMRGHEFNSSNYPTKLINALSIQCFLTEFIYPISSEENKQIRVLIETTKKEFVTKSVINWQAVSIISLYRNLSELEWLPDMTPPKEFEDIFVTHIRNSKDEMNLIGGIERDHNVVNNVSKRVRNQYEENPYPRWQNPKDFLLKPMPISKILKHEGSKIGLVHFKEHESVKVLIAGCGTGHQSIIASKNIQNAEIHAIDLSLPSLGYAKRKTQELGVKNITYKQMDILNLKGLEINYDYIECAGVLHHMQKPIDGLTSLMNVLHDKGVMKISLYSAIARQKLKPIQKWAKEEKINGRSDTILQVREMIKKSNNVESFSSGWLSMTDFYSRSMFRDLIFHEMEHCFNLLEIRNIFQDLKLQFLGMCVPTRTLNHFKNQAKNKTEQYDIEKWHDYEIANPATFVGMYHIFCAKI